MLRSVLYGFSLSVLPTLCACAPQDIATGTEERADAAYYKPENQQPRDEMRYPVAGISTSRDQYLYRINNPVIMQNIQETQHSRLFSDREKNDALIRINTPRQRSPFRQ